MRYEELKFDDEQFPLILRDDCLKRSRHVMFAHHHHAVEILLVKEGELLVHSGKERERAVAGQMVCIHSGNLHLYESVTEQCRYYCIIFPRKSVDSKELYRSSLPRVTDDAQAIDMMLQLAKTIEAGEKFYKEKSKGLLLQLYVRLVQLGGKEHYADELRPARLVKSAMEYIDSHYYQPTISVERVAKAAGVSRSHLCHVFKDVTGQSVSSYWQSLRCDLARRYLLDGYSVAETAEWSGFSSQSYFCRAYQKHFGVLPSKDRGK